MVQEPRCCTRCSKPAWATCSVILSPKIKLWKSSSVVECLWGRYKVLGSIHGTANQFRVLAKDLRRNTGNYFQWAYHSGRLKEERTLSLFFSLSLLSFVFFLETVSHICHAGLKLAGSPGVVTLTLIFLSLPSKCWEQEGATALYHQGLV